MSTCHHLHRYSMSYCITPLIFFTEPKAPKESDFSNVSAATGASNLTL